MASEKKKKFPVVKTVVYGVFVVITILAFVFTESLFGVNSVFNKTVCDNGVINTLYQKIPALIRSVQILTIAVLLSVLLKFLMTKLLAKSKRGLTVEKLLNSFLKWIIGIAAVLLILSAWGVDTLALLASAGILALVVGLGAQSLIADIIAGLFIVVEGEYQVGDIVIIDDWRGTVQEIGIRTTKIVDAGGNIKIINNSEIKSLINQTQELSLAKSSISIEYGESIPRVEIVIRDNLDAIKEHIPAIVEGPFYKGVSELASSSVDLLFVAKCKEEDIYQVQRDMNRELKIMFDKNGINVPFPQIVLNQPSTFNNKTTETEVAGANVFVEEQKELSKGLEEKTE